MIYLCTAEAKKMIKIIFISIIGVVCLAAARYSPVTVVNAHPSAIARCLADNLYRMGIYWISMKQIFQALIKNLPCIIATAHILQEHSGLQTQ